MLDAGCGSGRVTQMLLDRLPNGRVFAVDAAPSMVDIARANLDPERTTAWVSDLVELEVPEPVDAVLSTAVFHWIPDHDELFARLHAVMKPGARIEAQCGGEGNIGAFHEITAAVGAEPPFAEHLAHWAGPWNFASTTSRISLSGAPISWLRVSDAEGHSKNGSTRGSASMESTRKVSGSAVSVRPYSCSAARPSPSDREPLSWKAAGPGPYVRGRSGRIDRAAGTIRRQGLAECVLG